MYGGMIEAVATHLESQLTTLLTGIRKIRRGRVFPANISNSDFPCVSVDFFPDTQITAFCPTPTVIETHGSVMVYLDAITSDTIGATYSDFLRLLMSDDRQSGLYVALVKNQQYLIDGQSVFLRPRGWSAMYGGQGRTPSTYTISIPLQFETMMDLP